MTKQPNESSGEQLDQALTEIDVLDGDDKNIYRVDADTFRFQDIEYKIIEDYQEAFDIEMMEHRFTDYLLKYDYIVGDIAYEKLRLRGFYEDYRKGVPLDMKISNLEDYLVEYCNFGCQYFVFERVEKKKEDPESYFKRNKKSNRNKKGKQAKRRSSNKKGQSKQNPKQSNRPKDFQVTKKEEVKGKKTKKSRNKAKEKTQKSNDKKQFKIRKKKDE